MSESRNGGKMTGYERAILAGPHKAFDDKGDMLIEWAGAMYWPTISDRIRLFFGFATIDEIAEVRMPHLSEKRRSLADAPPNNPSRSNAA